MCADITESNPKALEQIVLNLKSLEATRARTGWFESAKYPDGTPVAYVAAIQEFGHGPIPPRSFFRTTAAEKQQEWSEAAGRVAARVVEGKMTAFDAMDLIGAKSRGDVSQKIASINAPPLSAITLGARKLRSEGVKITGKMIGIIAARLKAGTLDISGVSTKPLNDTGYMIATLTHVTERV